MNITLPSPLTIARSQRKGSFGRRGVPVVLVQAMYSEYRGGLSKHKMAPKWGRSAQAIGEIFRNHGLKLRRRKFRQKVNYGGLVYTPDKDAQLRCTTLDRHRLSHRIWHDRTGRKVPAGWQVSFRDGNVRNFTQANLVCAPESEITRMHQRRLHPASSLLTPRQYLLHRRKNNLARYYRNKLKWSKLGLTTQGKVYKRSKNSAPYGTVGRPCKKHSVQRRPRLRIATTPLQQFVIDLRSELDRRQPEDVYA